MRTSTDATGDDNLGGVNTDSVPKRLAAFCPNCGKAFSDGDHFCAACGAARESISKVTNPPAQEPALAGPSIGRSWKPWGVYPQSGAGWIGLALGGIVGFILALLLFAPGGPVVWATTFGCALIGGGIADALLGRPNRGWTIGTGAAALVLAVILAAFGVGFPSHSSNSSANSQLPPSPAASQLPKVVLDTSPDITNARVSGPTTLSFNLTPEKNVYEPNGVVNSFTVKLLDDNHPDTSIIGSTGYDAGPYVLGATYFVVLNVSELSQVDSTHHVLWFQSACVFTPSKDPVNPCT